MKILHIISDTVLGGAQKVLIDLANSAVQDGNTVAVAAMKGGYLWEQLNPNVKQYQLKYMLKKINLRDFLVLGELKKIKKEFSPDIIHLHTTKPGVLGRIIFRKNKNHIVYTVHGFDVVRTEHRKFLPVEKFFQRFTGATVPVSKYDEKNLISEKITKNLHTIYNGIDENLIKKAKNFPIQIKESKIILTIARISPQKKFDMFLEVAKEFQNKDTAFVWIGGATDKTIEQIKEEYNVPENVYLLGDIPNASNYINLCDIFVLFSHFEGLPMSIIEAMSQKKAIIASDVGGICELVDYSNGALIHSKEEAIQEITDLLLDSALLDKKNNTSYEKYKKNFTLTQMWKNYNELYKTLLKN